MRSARLWWVLAAVTLAGCSSPPSIPVNDKQTLVLEHSVTAAGISADKPGFSTRGGRPTASSTLYNDRNQPTILHYRFYWYDAKGLEIQPLAVPGSVMVPAQGKSTITGSAPVTSARKVRLYLYL